MNVCNMIKRLMKKKYAEKAGMWVTDKTFDKSSYPKSFTYWFCTLGPLCMHQTTHIKWKILVRFRYALQNFEMEKGIGMSTDAQKEMFVCMHEINKKAIPKSCELKKAANFHFFLLF